MIILNSPSEMRSAVEAARAKGRRVGFVPTMGFLHAGHMSLVERARSRADFIVMSIFVNPTQFGPNEDLSRYPRDRPRDTAMATEGGVDVLFVPSVSDMYPDGFGTSVSPGALGDTLEGATRPGHFQGVLTVVAKLLNIVDPHVAAFGQKDFQQALLIRRMVRDLNMAAEIIVAPIVREADGLAMSSRNVYLSPDERVQARALSEALADAAAAIGSGERDAAALIALVTTRLRRERDAVVDYVTVSDIETLQPIQSLRTGQGAVIALAVRIGKTRLIDNSLIQL